MEEGQREIVARAAKLAAQLLLSSGAETYRAEETVRHICAAFGYKIDIFALPTGLMLTLDDDVTIIGRVPRRTVDMTKIDRVNDVSRRLSSRAMEPEAALDELLEITGTRGPGRVQRALYAGGASAMFALMFGGGWFDVAAAGAVGLVTQALVNFLPDEAGMPLSNLFGGLLTAFFAALETRVFGMGDMNRIIISAMMPFLPGLAITNAIRDAMRGDLVSGMARAGDALTRAVLLASGAGLSVWLWMQW